jgi:hypothetical protein
MDESSHIRPVRATLLPDCSIKLGVWLPGWDEPQVTVTTQSTDFLIRVGSDPRPINLDGGDRTDELAREHIAKHIRWIEGRIEGQRRYRRYEQVRQRQAVPALAAYEPYAC